MKIAILADPLDNQNAGVHIYTKSLVEELLKRKDQHEYILVRQKKDPSLNVRQIIVPNISLPIGYASLRLFFIIPYILRKEKVDVVIEPAHFGPFNLPQKVKRITIIHDLTPIKFPEHHRWHSQILQRIFLKRILQNTQFIITNSKNTSRDLEKYYPFTKNKNKAILLGKEAIYQTTYNAKVLKELGINKKYFLSVGTIEPRKNLICLLHAFQQFVNQNGSNFDLVIAGGMGWKSEDFQNALAQHPFRKQIKILGYVKKEILPVLYTHSTALIYPSLYEGFGFPVLEAMACGTSVICSNTSSLPEVGGKLAHYFSPSSAEELTILMIKVSQYSEAHRQQIYEKSLTHAAQFSWKKHVDLFMETIENLSYSNSQFEKL